MFMVSTDGLTKHFDPHQRTIASVSLSQREAINKYEYLKEQINTFMFMYAHTVCIKLQNLRLCVCVSFIWEEKTQGSVCFTIRFTIMKCVDL